MFAVIRIGPTQYHVKVGDVVEAAHMPGTVGTTIKLSEVLLIDGQGRTTVGTPVVQGASVEAVIEAQHRGEKIHVRRFKSKVRERRHIGFRAELTRLRISAIHA
jgi:large subunit ribosomal protein L21